MGFESVVSHVCTHIRNTLKAELAGVLLFNADTNHLEMQAPALGFESKVCRVHLNENCPCVHVYTSGEATLVPDAACDPRVLTRYKQMFGLRSMVMAPIMVNRQRLGVFHVANKPSGPFTAADLAHVTELTQLLASPLESRLLSVELAAKAQLRGLIARTTSELAGQREAAGVARLVGERAQALAGAPAAAVLQMTEDGTLENLWGAATGAAAAVVRTVAQRAARTGQPVIARQHVAVPMYAGADLEGVLVVWPCASGAAADIACTSLLEVAPVAALALRHARQGVGERRADAGLQVSVRGLQAQNQLLSRTLAAQRRLNALITNGSSLDVLCADLSDLLGRPVALYSPALRLTAQGEPERPAPGGTTGWAPPILPVPVRAQLLSEWAAERPVREMVNITGPWRHGCGWAVPVQAGRALLGCLLLAGTAEGFPPSHLAVEQAAQACALALTGQQALAGAHVQRRSEWLADLLEQRETLDPRLAQRGLALGYDLSCPARVFVLCPIPSGAGTVGAGPWCDGLDLLAEVARAVADRYPGSLVARRGDRLVVLLALADAGSDQGRSVAVQAGRRLSDEVLESGAAVVVGIGGCCRQPSDYPRAFAEAMQVADILQTGHDAVACAEDVGSVEMLLWQACDRRELRLFAHRTLAPLLAYDQAHATELRRTLATYLDHECQLATTATVLFIHQNTLRYRLQKIRRLGISLDDAASRFALRLALLVYHSGAPA